MWDENFSLAHLTDTFINGEGFYVPGQIGALGIFEEDGISETVLKVEYADGVLTLVEPTSRGGPGQTVGDGDRKIVSFVVDHFQIDDALNADEVQNVRAFGTADQLETIQSKIESKLRVHASSFNATEEHLRVGAIKGIILSGKGRVLHNLYNQFEIAIPAPIALGLGDDVSGLAERIKKEVVYRTEDALDAPYDHVHSVCGRDFHDYMWRQKEVRETYLADRQGHVLRDGAPDVFTIGKVTFERYRTGQKATHANGGAAFIAANEARCFPVGVPGLFITRNAPGDLEETVNTIGLPRYAIQYPMQNGKGRHLDVQMNQINLCTKPSVLQTLTI